VFAGPWQQHLGWEYTLSWCDWEHNQHTHQQCPGPFMHDDRIENSELTVCMFWQISFSGAVMTIDPLSPLTSGILYTVEIGSSLIQDKYGNLFAGFSGSTYSFAVSDTCTYTFAGFTCSSTECVVSYSPADIVCGNTDDLKYIASTTATIKLQNITAAAAVSGDTITVVQTSPLGLRVGKGNGLIWPEYVDPLA
jgi:hypothetical protein